MNSLQSLNEIFGFRRTIRSSKAWSNPIHLSLRAMSYFNSNDNICQSKNVQAFFDGELDSEKKLLVEQHLSECTACNHELKAIRSLQLLVRMALSSGSQISIAPVAYPQKDHQLNVKR